ncbi:MAG: hypothetical protein RSA51_07270 [Niameybacter sp.]
MNEEEFRIRLNMGQAVEIFGLKVRNYTLNEIVEDLGYSKFKYLREFVNLEPDSFEEEMNKSIEAYMYEVKEYLVMTYQDIEYDLDFTLYDMCAYIPFIKAMFIEFLQTFTMYEDISVEHKVEADKLKIECDRSLTLELNREEFEAFLDYFSVLNFTTKVDRGRTQDSQSVKDFDKKAQEIKMKYGVKNKQGITLESIISALINSNNPNYTHKDIGCKTIYQIMDSFGRICKMKENDFMNLLRCNGMSKIGEEEVRRSMWYYNLY